MLTNLQSRVNARNAKEGDFAALAEKAEGMFADSEIINRAAFVGYILGVRATENLAIELLTLIQRQLQECLKM